jgi:glycine hydroxymethyltransferase
MPRRWRRFLKPTTSACFAVGPTIIYLLADVYGSLGITGQEAETVLDEVGITLNKNMIADETRTALDPSGIRFGTPAMTTRGMKEGEAKQLAELMVRALRARTNPAELSTIKAEVQALCEKFPVPESFVE